MLPSSSGPYLIGELSHISYLGTPRLFPVGFIQLLDQEPEPYGSVNAIFEPIAVHVCAGLGVSEDIPSLWLCPPSFCLLDFS